MNLLYNKNQCKANLFIKFLSLFLVLISSNGFAQSPTISYPSTAQNITRGYANSDMTVKIIFNGACSGATTVKIALPNSVKYISGSVSKTGGTSALGISESSISDLSNPIFTISGITAIADEITFKISRKADCGTLATGKDSVFVYTSGGCSNGSETIGTINNYNIIAPSLTIAAPAALSGVVIDTTATRTTVITNGGNGVTDTLRFYLVYPNSGILLTTTSNAITANSVSFLPVRTSGDTLFYHIFGATIFGGDNLFNNGETVIISEPIKVKKCNTVTTYGAAWGRTDFTICDWTTATSSISEAVGVPNFTGIIGTRIGYVDKCTPYDYTMAMKNGGIGNPKAAGMYDLKIEHATYYNPTYFRDFDTSILSLSNIRIGSTAVPSSAIRWIGGKQYISLKNVFTADPDGVGVGLDDLDNDGYFDDLAGGQTVTMRVTQTNKCSITCGRDKVSYVYTGAQLTYNEMCSPTATTTTLAQSSGLNMQYEATFQGVAYVPANVVGGNTFRFEAKQANYVNSSSFDNTNTRYRWKIALPSGFAVSGTGNPKYGTATTTYTTTSGGASGVDTIVCMSASNSLANFGIDLVYTCGTGGTKTFFYALEKIDNVVTGCFCQGKLVCATITTNAFCSSPCSVGPSNFVPQVRRADGSLGWTNYTLSTRQSASAISAYDLSKALYLDTIQIISNAKQNSASSNLYLELTLPKTTVSPTGQNKLTAVNAVSKVYRSGSLISTFTTNSVSSSASTSTTQSLVFDLSAGVSALSGGRLEAGDSINTVASYIVALNAGLAQNDIQSGERNIYYNLNSSGVREFCDSPVPEMYLVGTTILNGTNPWNASGCSNVTLGGGTNYIARRFNTSGINYANEYRPVFYVDSVVATIPAGYNFVNANYQPVNGGATITGLTPTSVVGNVYKFVNPGTWTVPRLTVTNTYGAYLPFTVTPNCGTVNGEVANFKIYIRDYYYAYAGNPTPAGLSYELHQASTGAPTGLSSSISYVDANKPDISLSDLTGTVQGVKSTQSWTFRMTNTGLISAPFTWFAIPNNPNIAVTQVSETATGTILSPIAYGGGKWYKLSTSGIASGTNVDYKIDFTYSSCSLDSLKVLAGWNCTEYPTSPDSYTCGVDSLKLKVNSEPSEVQLSVSRQPGGGTSIPLCTEDSILLVVNSSKSANLIDPYVIVYPPAGLNISSTIKVEYPLGSGNYQNATVSAITGGGLKIDLKAHTAIGLNGILGTASSSSSYSPLGGDRQAKIKISFNTDCSLISGNSFVFYAFGKMPCGIAAQGNGVSATTSALNITGANAAGSAGAIIDIGSTTISCGTPTTLSLATVPTTLGTQVGDTMIYTLPAGIGYAGNFVKGTNCTSCEVSSNDGLGGTTIVKVKLQTGVAAASVLNYSFDVVPKGESCASSNIQGSFKRLISPLSCGALLCASSSVYIANVTSPNITIKKPILNLTAYSLVDTNTWLLSSATNKVKIKYSNSGTQAYSANVDSVEFFCGSNTTPFAIMPLTKNIAIGASDSDTYNIILPTTGCAGIDLVTTYAKIRTTTEAGTKQCLCSGSSIILNTTPSKIDTIYYCQGATPLPLTATGYNLRWYTTATGGIGTSTAPTPSTATPGNVTYFVSQTSDLLYESARVPITVNVQSAPDLPTVTTPVNICQGTTATALTATAPKATDTLLWYTMASGGTPSLSAPTPTTSTTSSNTYYVSAKSNIGCEGNRAAMVVNINPTPSTPTTTTTIAYCQGETASALSATGTNLKWYTTASGGTAASTAPTPSTTSDGTTNYYVSQSNASTIGGCESAREMITVTVNPLPTAPTVSSSVSYCQGETASSLSATGTSLKWYTTASGGTASTTAPTPSTATATSTTYYVSQTSAASVGGCEGSRSSIVVTVNPLPTAPIVTSSVSYCQGETASALSATGTSLKWYTTASGGTASTTAPTPSTATSTSTTYYVSQTSAASVGGCEGTRSSIMVTVNPLPTAPIVTSSVSYCQGETASSLSATGTSLKWYTTASGGTASTTAPTPSTATSTTLTYYVSQTSAASVGGCEGSRSSIVVTVNPLPAAPTVTSPIAYCAGASPTSLTATGTNLKWYTTASGGTASTTAPTPSTATATSTTYYVSQTSVASAGGCEGTRSSIAVTVNPLPTAPGVVSPTNLCIGSTATSIGAIGSNLKWYTTATGGTGSSTAPIPSTSTLSTNTYYVSQTSAPAAGGCEGARATLVVQVQPLPTVNIASLSSTGFIYCRAKSISLKAIAPTATTYQWSYSGGSISGASNDTIVADKNGIYKVEVRNIYGCLNKDSISVMQDTSMIPVLSPAEVKICEESSQLLTVNPGFVGWTFEWQKEGSTFAAADYINLKNVSLSGTYTVIAKNKVGCIDTTNEAHISYYPKPIKPTIDNKDPLLEVPNTYRHYQWYKNGVKLISTNIFKYLTTTPGSYHVEVSDDNGCLNQSDTIIIKNTTGINTTVLKSELKIYPNPSRNIVYIEAPIKVTVKVTDITGRTILESKEATSIDLSNYADGNYILMITDSDNNLITVEKISKMQ